MATPRRAASKALSGFFTICSQQSSAEPSFCCLFGLALCPCGDCKRGSRAYRNTSPNTCWQARQGAKDQCILSFGTEQQHILNYPEHSIHPSSMLRPKVEMTWCYRIPISRYSLVKDQSIDNLFARDSLASGFGFRCKGVSNLSSPPTTIWCNIRLVSWGKCQGGRAPWLWVKRNPISSSCWRPNVTWVRRIATSRWSAMSTGGAMMVSMWSILPRHGKSFSSLLASLLLWRILRISLCKALGHTDKEQFSNLLNTLAARLLLDDTPQVDQKVPFPSLAIIWDLFLQHTNFVVETRPNLTCMSVLAALNSNGLSKE